MKATGIVRRIDELGRIVIPKEIRRTLRIRETDPMEIFTDKEGEIVLKKYSPLGELAECAKEYSESLARTTGNVVCISDREQIIAMSGTVKKELVEKPVSDKLEQIMQCTQQADEVAGQLHDAGKKALAGIAYHQHQPDHRT